MCLGLVWYQVGFFSMVNTLMLAFFLNLMVSELNMLSLLYFLKTFISNEMASNVMWQIKRSHNFPFYLMQSLKKNCKLLLFFYLSFHLKSIHLCKVINFKVTKQDLKSKLKINYLTSKLPLATSKDEWTYLR